MKIHWTIELNDANLVLAVLGKLPYEQVVFLIDELRKQAMDQQTSSERAQIHNGAGENAPRV